MAVQRPLFAACECYTYWKQIYHDVLAQEVADKYNKPEYASYKVVSAVLVFDGQYQHLQFRSGYLHSLQELIKKYGVKFFVIASDMDYKFESYREYISNCIIKKLPIQVIDFPALARRKGQELAVALDDAILYAERKPDNGVYGGYTLDVNTLYPPKIACFGSSSRILYNTAKDIHDFIFEKKMPTTVGGTANLDGYYNSPEHHIFIEAKCREPYSEKSNIISRKYEKLYECISNSPENNITCEIGSVTDEKKMKVTFKYDEKVIRYFDIKQLISHYLGSDYIEERIPTTL